MKDFIEETVIKPSLERADADPNDPISVIKNIVSVVFDVDVLRFRQKNRGDQRTAYARHVAMSLCVDYRLGTLEYIGSRFSRGHSVVKFTCQSVENQTAGQDPMSKDFRRKYDECRRRISEHPLFAGK